LFQIGQKTLPKQNKTVGLYKHLWAKKKKKKIACKQAETSSMLLYARKIIHTMGLYNAFGCEEEENHCN
jgi:hypothetical protein